MLRVASGIPEGLADIRRVYVSLPGGNRIGRKIKGTAESERERETERNNESWENYMIKYKEIY